MVDNHYKLVDNIVFLAILSLKELKFIANNVYCNHNIWL